MQWFPTWGTCLDFCGIGSVVLDNDIIIIIIISKLWNTMEYAAHSSVLTIQATQSLFVLYHTEDIESDPGSAIGETRA